MPLFPGQAAPTALGLIQLAGDFAAASTALLPIIGSLSGASPFPITPNILQWVQGATPQFSQAQQANGSPPASWTWAPQAPGAGAASTANGTPGSAIVALALPVSTGAEPQFKVTRNNVALAAIRYDVADGSTTDFFGFNGTTGSFYIRHAAAYTMLNSSTVIYLAQGGTVYVRVDNNGLQLGAQSAAYGGGAKVVGITNATTIPTTNPSGGGVLYESAGALTHRGSSGTITGLSPA